MVRMDENMPFLLQYEHVAWYDNGKVRILDRRVYPTEVRFVECVTYQEVVQAIADKVTQSAGPYTAVGMGMAVAAWQVRDKGAAEQDAFLQQAAYDLAHARPTTANRYGQITYRCAEVAKEALAAGKDPIQAIVENTVESLNRRYSTMQVVGDYLANLIPNGGAILTQCFGHSPFALIGVHNSGENILFATHDLYGCPVSVLIKSLSIFIPTMVIKVGGVYIKNQFPEKVGV